jgi:hypothetical protein
MKEDFQRFHTEVRELPSTVHPKFYVKLPRKQLLKRYQI